MARLLKKIPNDLKDLKHSWTSRDEFMVAVLGDIDFIPNVRSALPNDGDFLKTPNNWIKHMFMPTGWQLTAFGCTILLRAYNSYRIPGPSKDTLTGRQVLKLNELVNGPWYLNKSAIYVWNRETNFELNLFDADLDQYINTYFPK